MASDYLCPKCGAKYGSDDINVQNDLALCRACGTSSDFSVVTGIAELSNVPTDPPSTINIATEDDGGLRLTYRKTSWLLFIIAPFWLLWTCGSMAMIFGPQIQEGQFDAQQSVIAVPFAAGSLTLLVLLLWLWRGRWEIVMNDGRGTVFVGVAGLGWTRRFSYNAESIVMLQWSEVQIGEVQQKAVLVRTGSNELMFGALINDDAKRFIAATIKRVVDAS